ncbi:MAG: YbhB/YbcL family Raf kinase inhibitor-like protein [Alcanivorax sp.]|nr:YbhB/YbcL family Raf kinase inhibitor-like protein [Alcanivorax sp.]
MCFRFVSDAGRALMATLLMVVSGRAGAADFQLWSPDLGQPPQITSRYVYNGLGCQGGNVSPALQWRHPPAGTRSFAVTVHDPDAPGDGGWWHWLVFNISADVRAIPVGASGTDAMPATAVESRTDFGKPGYGGPCPPPGDAPHRYRFRVVALDVATLPLDAQTPAAQVGFMINQHRLAEAQIQVTYGR